MPGLAHRLAARCLRRATSCTKARIWGGGYGRSGSAGTSSPPCSSGCWSTSSAQADKWALNYEAAKQFYEREGHLRVPRKHVERILVGGGDGKGGSGDDQEVRELRLGAWIGNQRSRAATLSPDRMELLSTIGMRWS
ncbi:helicase associated domain-containing protein [Streptomyces cinerochromogenes]|uniref:helicase associated domain-containing protein n=1 Tax=Streptomyces cinerochromogenes TaxID=66422 RepID=UPI003F53F6FC